MLLVVNSKGPPGSGDAGIVILNWSNALTAGVPMN